MSLGKRTKPDLDLLSGFDFQDKRIVFKTAYRHRLIDFQQRTGGERNQRIFKKRPLNDIPILTLF